MKKTTQRGEKTRFVIDFGAEKPIDEIIDAARDVGLELSSQHVYQVRSRLRTDPASVGTLKRSARRSEAERSAEQRFQDIALTIGFRKAAELLEQTRELVRGIVEQRA